MKNVIKLFYFYILIVVLVSQPQRIIKNRIGLDHSLVFIIN